MEAIRRHPLGAYELVLKMVKRSKDLKRITTIWAGTGENDDCQPVVCTFSATLGGGDNHFTSRLQEFIKNFGFSTREEKDYFQDFEKSVGEKVVGILTDAKKMGYGPNLVLPNINRNKHFTDPEITDD